MNESPTPSHRNADRSAGALGEVSSDRLAAAGIHGPGRAGQRLGTSAIAWGSRQGGNAVGYRRQVDYGLPVRLISSSCVSMQPSFCLKFLYSRLRRDYGTCDFPAHVITGARHEVATGRADVGPELNFTSCLHVLCLHRFCHSPSVGRTVQPARGCRTV